MNLLMAQATASSAPQIVFEDSLAIGQEVTALTLDSLHFSAPVLLVGTDTAGTGQSFVLRVQAAPLAILDTIAELGSPVRLVVAGYVDGDNQPDILVGLDSMFIRYLSSRVPDTDTIHIGAPIRKLAIDDINHSTWVAFAHTTTSYTIHRLDSGVMYFDSTSVTGIPVSVGGAGIDLTIAQVHRDSAHEAIISWQYAYDWPATGPGAPNTHIDMFGYQWNASKGSTKATDTLYNVSVFGVGHFSYLTVFTPIVVVDLDGDGVSELIASHWGMYWGQGPPPTYDIETAVYSLATGQLLWRVWRAGRVCPWDVDGDSLPDVLRIEQGQPGNPSAMYAYKGTTGEELWNQLTPFDPFPLAYGTLDSTGIQKAVTASFDTLRVYRLDLATSVGGDDNGIKPTTPTLYPNYPNPFNARTTIRFVLTSPSSSELVVHNILGQRIRRLIDQVLGAGEHTSIWDGLDDNGQPVASGVYLISLVAGDDRVVRKAMLLK